MGDRCPVCSTELPPEKMADHLSVVHPSYRPAEQEARRHQPHRCVFCGETLRTPEDLKEHHRTAHGR